ncbi:MAG: serine/threonine-protein phosphatase [Chloroflexi bacterium]|nr:serine/threonine-protein phosphatase [Chloroflexota bacterium]
MSQPSTTALHVHIAMATDIGRRRKQNQDAIGQLTPAEPEILARQGQIFVLADGVGGLERGDLASQYAVSTIIQSYYEQEDGEPPDRLARAIAEANTVIHAEGQGDSPAIMAATVVAAVIRGAELVIGSVGDSPAYLIRDTQPRQLTLDHTVEAMQDEAGEALPEGVSEDATGAQLVRALGSQPSVKVDIITGRVRAGDYVVLCSDGLTRYLSPQEIEQTVSTQPVESAAQALVEMANERGGADNVSVIVLHLDEADLARLLEVPDPMETWGHPRRMAERTRLRQPTVRVPVPEAPVEAAPRAENPVEMAIRFLRGNLVVAGVSMSIALVAFVVIMLVIAGAGDESQNGPTPIPPPLRTATLEAVLAVTAQAAAAATNDVILENTAAAAARRTLTPPTAVPTSGPQMMDGTWFRVLEGDPIPAYQSPSMDADGATALEPGENYRITLVSHGPKNGPWYELVDRYGEEVRWVNAPSLHARIEAIDASGSALPPDQQPIDLPPPGVVYTPTPSRTPPPPVTLPGTPGTMVTATPQPSATSRPSIPYGVEGWEADQTVVMLTDLDLCHIPDVTACDVGTARAGETGTIADGPVPAGEHWWWQIEFEDGRTGWIAQVLLAAP